jgi:transposase InsO family protein
METSNSSDEFKRDAVQQITVRGYLSVVINLFSRHVLAWCAQPRMTTDLALQALLAAVWRRKPNIKM